MFKRLLPAFLPLAVLAGCTSAPTAPPVVTAPPPPPLPPGLARLVGLYEPRVLALLGPASMARDEGPARQLQFIRPPCVLDVFLYPVANARAPQVRTAAARRPDGSRMEPGICFGLIAPPAG
ncbi:hypothetical protein [Polymorphobacter sp.]|uniref:hypothetical protein n=1 Tax=Polymorphobacter sp. TaxID=1909290 RepID=UPI003F717262